MKLHLVPAKQGILWVKLGVQVFFRQPLAMCGLFFMFIALVSVLSLIPFIGGLLALVVIPAATLGYMAATNEAIKGKFPIPTILITAFRAGRERLSAMLVLGAAYAAAFLGVMGLSVLIDGGSFANMYLVGGPMDAQVITQPSFLVAMYVSLALYIPISLAFWHAPALVHWHGMSPMKSLFFSTVACFKNIGAFTVYGALWFALMLGAGLAVSLVGALLGGAQLAGVLMMPAILLVACMFFSSLFFTFHDCFIEEEKVETV
jgi:hypothetical protein